MPYSMNFRPIEPNATLIAPVALDYYDSSNQLSAYSIEPPKLDFAETYKDSGNIAMAAAYQILQLKRGFDPSKSALDIANPQLQLLRADRAHAAIITGHFASDLIGQHPAKMPIIYGFADVAELGERDPNRIYRAKFLGHTLLVRAEETLAAHADAIALGVMDKVSRGYDGVMLDGTTIIRKTKAGEDTKLNLRGYTFNRGAIDPTERKSFPEFPACETSMAAAVLEQVSIAGRVIRLIPFSMKDREYSARFLLDVLGVADLPVLSIAISEAGDVQKLIPWSSKVGLFDDIKEISKSMSAHDQSTRVIKSVHDQLFSEHRTLHRQRDVVPVGAMAPSALLGHTDLGQRVHNFFSQMHLAAPVHEANKIKPDETPLIVADLHQLRALFHNRHDQLSGTPLEHFPEVTHHPGRGSNNVAYTKATIASIKTSASETIHLIAHIVHEGVNDHLISQLRNTASSSLEFIDALVLAPPRYVLVEARRC